MKIAQATENAPATKARVLVALAGAALVFAVTPLAPGVLSGASMREPVRNIAAVHSSPKVETRLESKLQTNAATAVPSAILMSTTAASTSTSEARSELLDERPTLRSSKSTSPPVKPAKKRKPRPAAQFYAGSPTEQCAGRGFFVRSYCLQRACKAPAFRSSAQCAPYQSEARLAHY